MNILLYLEKDAGKWQQRLAQGLPQACIHTDLDAPACDYAVVWKPPNDLFDRQARLRAIFALGAGVDGLLQHPGLPREVPLIRMEDSGMARQMIEYALYAALHQFRSFDHYRDAQAAAEWRPLRIAHRPRFQIGVLGLGVLGAQVAQALAAFGFAVRGWSRTPRSIAGIDCQHGADGLDAVLASSQLLVLMLPATDETKELIDHERLARLPQGAALVNLARGSLVHEGDLLAALDRGHLARAFLDVFATEPLPAHHPFWSHPRVTVTPHVAALTPSAEATQQVIDKILALERGEAVSGVVDRERGY